MSVATILGVCRQEKLNILSKGNSIVFVLCNDSCQYSVCIFEQANYHATIILGFSFLREYFHLAFQIFIVYFEECLILKLFPDKHFYLCFLAYVYFNKNRKNIAFKSYCFLKGSIGLIASPDPDYHVLHGFVYIGGRHAR